MQRNARFVTESAFIINLLSSQFCKIALQRHAIRICKHSKIAFSLVYYLNLEDLNYLSLLSPLFLEVTLTVLQVHCFFGLICLHRIIVRYWNLVQVLPIRNFTLLYIFFLINVHFHKPLKSISRFTVCFFSLSKIVVHQEPFGYCFMT